MDLFGRTVTTQCHLADQSNVWVHQVSHSTLPYGSCCTVLGECSNTLMHVIMPVQTAMYSFPIVIFALTNNGLQALSCLSLVPRTGWADPLTLTSFTSKCPAMGSVQAG